MTPPKRLLTVVRAHSFFRVHTIDGRLLGSRHTVFVTSDLNTPPFLTHTYNSLRLFSHTFTTLLWMSHLCGDILGGHITRATSRHGRPTQFDYSGYVFAAAASPSLLLMMLCFCGLFRSPDVALAFAYASSFSNDVQRRRRRRPPTRRLTTTQTIDDGARIAIHSHQRAG